MTRVITAVVIAGTAAAAITVPLAPAASAGTGRIWAKERAGKCIEIEGSGTKTGTRIQLWSCTPNTAGKQWRLRRPRGHHGNLRWIYNPGSGKCLSIDGVETGVIYPGDGAQLEPCEWQNSSNGKGDDSVWWFSGTAFTSRLWMADGQRARLTRSSNNNGAGIFAYGSNWPDWREQQWKCPNACSGA